jgi:hypothetical protein
MYRLLAAVALVAATVHPVSGQNPKDSTLAAARDSRPAAAAGLDTLRALAKEHYAILGFSEAGQAATATLGEPLVEFLVRLDSLRAYTSTTNPASLLSGGDKVMYPVTSGAETRSSIEVDRVRGAWRPVSYGGQNLAAAVVKQRDALAAAENRAPADYFLVRVPALGLVFIGVNNAGVLTLTPLADDPQGRWKAGAPLPAATIFGLLVTDAQAAKDLPM